MISTVLAAAILLSSSDSNVGLTTEEIDGGARTSLWSRETAKKEHIEGLKRAAASGAKTGPSYEYKTEPRCGNASVDAAPCTAAAAGPCPSAIAALNVFRRQVNPTGAWEQVGIACNSTEVPATREPGMADIIRAFHDTNFTVPTMKLDPRGNRTLVNLPTYAEVTWPVTGFKPEEIDTRTLPEFPGYTIQIKPTLSALTYHFGDGATAGPTTSLGGPHPTGDIVHTYTSPANFHTRVDVTYAGFFRFDDGDWISIPDTVDITGTPTPLTVVEARSQLVLE